MIRLRAVRRAKVKPEVCDGHTFATPNEALRFRAIRDRAKEIRHLGDGQGLAVFEYRFNSADRWEREAFRLAAPTRNKFGAKKTTIDGIRFDSKREARRYQVLRAREGQGQLTRLSLQQQFPLVVNGVKIATYVADFTYHLPMKDQAEVIRWVVEDSKGYRTREYQMKRKLMKALYGIEVVEV